MDFHLIIDKDAKEHVTVSVHAPSALTDEIEALVMRYKLSPALQAPSRREMRREGVRGGGNSWT